MTVVVALKDIENDRIIVGSDGQGTSDDISLNFGEKIFTLKIPLIEQDNSNDTDEHNVEEEVIGYDDLTVLVSGSHYLKNYLTGAFKPPSKIVSEPILDYLYNQFFQVLNNDLTIKTLLKNDNGALDSEAGLILVYNDKLFNVYSDFSIVEEPNCFTVHGSGWKIATSVLTNLLKHHTGMDKECMVKEALLTTGELNIYCNKDITIKTIGL